MSAESSSQASPGTTGGKTFPWGALLRFLALIALVIIGVLILTRTPLAEYLDRERLLATFERLRAVWWSPLLLISLLVCLSPLGVPASPVVLSGGVVFGALSGSIYNTLGLFLGATTTYLLGKLLGKDLIAHFAGPKLRRVERAFERRGFWPLVMVRFLPLPFALVNYGAAFAGVKPLQYLVATAIGLAPTTIMHTYFAATAIRAPAERQPFVMLQYLACWGLLAAISSIPTLRDRLGRKRRLQELREKRRLSRSQGSV